MTRTSAMWLAAFAALAGAWFCVPCNASAQPLPTTTWPQYQYSSDHNAVFDSPDWSVSWKAQAGDIIHGGLSIVGTTLYFESFDHNVYAVNALTGKEIWHRTLTDVVMNTPVVANGLVYAGEGIDPGISPDTLPNPMAGRKEGNSIYALDAATGRIVWRFRTVGHDMPTGVFLNDGGTPKFIFTGGDLHVYALNARTGKLLWKVPVSGVDMMASLAMSGGLIYGITGAKIANDQIYFQAGTVTNRMVNKQTWAVNSGGKFAWRTPVGEPGGSPTVAANTVFAESFEQNPTLWFPVLARPPVRFMRNTVTALDATTGDVLWSHQSGIGGGSREGSNMQTVAGAYADGRFYESFAAVRNFEAFDAKSGTLLWTLSTAPHPVKMSAVINDGLLYFGDAANTLYIVRAADGQVMQRVAFPDTFGISPPVIVGGTLFVANGKSVYAVPLNDLQRGAGPSS